MFRVDVLLMGVRGSIVWYEENKMSEEQGQDAPQAAAGHESDINVVTGGRPRRVMLRRNAGGAYEILIGRRILQSFCSEFENITRWVMPSNTQLPVRIEIIPSGEAQAATYPDREPAISRDRDQPILRARLAAEDDDPPEEVALFSTAHPGNPRITMTWQDEAREQLVRDIELRQNMIDLLARM